MNRSSLLKGAMVTAAILVASTLGAAPRGAGAGNGRGNGFGPGMMGQPYGYGMMWPGYGSRGSFGMMGGWPGMGRGMMGSWYGPGAWPWRNLPELDKPLTLDTAQGRVEAALKDWGYDNLIVDEVIQYANDFYALVKEKGTGKGAMELLVDPRTGAVVTEPGPSMMWNTKYGMRMVYPGSTGTSIGIDEAKRQARQWLEASGDKPAWQLDATEMYGYYSIHLVQGSKVDGMLSVNAYTGAIWYHPWHGAFVAAKETAK